MKRAFILFIPLLFLYNCGKESRDVPPQERGPGGNGENTGQPDTVNGHGRAISEHFVVRYYQMTGIIAQFRSGLIQVYPELKPGATISGNSQSQKYIDLCKKHGDIGFYGEYSLVDREPGKYTDKDFNSITLTSDRDFPGYPAGSELNGMVTYYALSPHPYIRSGYTETFDWDGYPGREKFISVYPKALTYENFWNSWSLENLHPRTGLLSGITAQEMVLLGNGSLKEYAWDEPLIVLELNAEPLDNGPFSIYITMTTDTGDEYTALVNIG